MIAVYFETRKHNYCERVALFANEELYNTCSTALHKVAALQNYVITEDFDFDVETLVEEKQHAIAK